MPFSFTLASRSSVQNRARFAPVSLPSSRASSPTSCGPTNRPLPSCSQPAPLGSASTPAPIGAPSAHNRGMSTSYVTSSQPESGADDTGAMSAGRWGRLSRLSGSATRVEVTETTRCHGTPGHRRRQTHAERSRAAARIRHPRRSPRSPTAAADVERPGGAILTRRAKLLLYALEGGSRDASTPAPISLAGSATRAMRDCLGVDAATRNARLRRPNDPPCDVLVDSPPRHVRPRRAPAARTARPA